MTYSSKEFRNNVPFLLSCIIFTFLKSMYKYIIIMEGKIYKNLYKAGIR